MLGHPKAGLEKFIIGSGLTVITETAVLLQPVVVIIPVTVKLVVMVGLAKTLFPVEVLNPVEGFQVYVVAPFAVNIAVSPSQIEGEFTVIVGSGFTKIFIVSVVKHVPLPKV